MSAVSAADLSDIRDLDVTVDRLTCDWKMVQRRRGHRHSTDDLLTGWYAAETVERRSRLLDLGSGVGSVGLLALWRSPGAVLTCIEAEEQSYRLLRKNIELNALSNRVRTILGDLRDVSVQGESFDLVTGSPPYFDVRSGVVSADRQRACARFEIRGGVNDYCVAARAAMDPGGRFVFCFPTVQRTRAEHACEAAGLIVVRSRDVVPRRGVAPLFTLFCCRRNDAPARLDAEVPLDGAAQREPPHVVRDEHGVPTPEHAAARASFGMH